IDETAEFTVTIAVVKSSERNYLQGTCVFPGPAIGAIQIDLPDDHHTVRKWPLGKRTTEINSLLRGTRDHNPMHEPPYAFVLMRHALWVEGEYPDRHETGVPGIILWLDEIAPAPASVKP